ncbi:gp105 [Erwinia phage vB_EamP-S6]|uniref:Gp105 n=1 Tax=Erwinia phage vB_EamP-S6 TaxID=1051675 RepID=G0YQJ7_9CAUD|nr:gp105 [Erwinia phage vB_EamP-S6]AEJ81624.1 gp105 [Erwinia phage vB_EamP-S6]
MQLIELLAQRQLLDGDTFGKTLFGVAYREMYHQDEHLGVKLYSLRFFLRNLHAPYRTADVRSAVPADWLNHKSVFNR